MDAVASMLRCCSARTRGSSSKMAGPLFEWWGRRVVGSLSSLSFLLVVPSPFGPSASACILQRSRWHALPLARSR